jgi:thiol-disulfide isomerase/thioredoxin
MLPHSAPPASGRGRPLRWLLTSRWLRAAAVAAAIVAWPACAQPPDEVHEAEGPAVMAPLDFTLKDMHGKDVRLADFKGRPLIVNFWATWCAPCKVEIPIFVELVDKYRTEQLTVLGISIDDTPEDLRAFAADFKINYPVLVGLNQNEIQEAYDAVFAIPVTWFIRADGSVYLKHTGPATKEWFEQQAQNLLAGGPAQETR